jgi:hypothetical protein
MKHISNFFGHAKPQIMLGVYIGMYFVIRFLIG